MKVLPLMLCLVAVCIGAQAQQDDDFYDSRYDYIDVDTILSNKRLVRNYVDCLLNLKPCTAEGKALRRILPEGLRTKCAKCTPKQKIVALAVLRKLRSDYPAEWARLVSRWDPTGDLTRRFEVYLESEDKNTIGDDKPSVLTPALPGGVNNVSLGNRFGIDEEESSPTEIKPTIRSVPKSSMRVPSPTTPRPKTSTTRRPPTYTYIPQKPLIDLTPVLDGTMDLIDHFGNKIIKTTEIVTDILKNTVRIVGGGG